VNNSSDLPRMVAAVKPGTKVPVELWRKGESKKVTVEVGEMPAESGKPTHAGKKPSDDSAETISRLGIAVIELNSEQLQELQISGGLLVQEVKGSAARTAGLHQGDVLLSVGNVQIRTLAHFNELLKQVPNGRNVALLVRRGDSASYVAIRLDEK
jgi:serine protease Do